MNNVHPIYNIKRLMLKQQLAKDPKLANENWERFLPKFKKTSEAKKPKKPKTAKPREKPLFPPPPMPRKEDIAMMTGQAFFDKKDKKKQKKEEGKQQAEEGKEEGRGEAASKKQKKRAREEEQGEQSAAPATQHRTHAPSTLDSRTAMEIANRLKGGGEAEKPEPAKKLKGEPEKHLRMQQKVEMKKQQKKNKKDKKKSKKKK